MQSRTISRIVFYSHRSELAFFVIPSRCPLSLAHLYESMCIRLLRKRSSRCWAGVSTSSCISSSRPSRRRRPGKCSRRAGLWQAVFVRREVGSASVDRPQVCLPIMRPFRRSSCLSVVFFCIFPLPGNAQFTWLFAGAISAAPRPSIISRPNVSKTDDARVRRTRRNCHTYTLVVLQRTDTPLVIYWLGALYFAHGTSTSFPLHY